MSERPRFVDWLARRLHAAGARRAFGVPGGGSSLDLIAALRGVGVETIVSAREDAAIMMAGVTGVLSNSPGIAFTTKGPGLASASNGLASAALDRMPVLVVAESFEPDELGFLSHQVFDQAGLAAPFLARAGSALVPPSAEGIEAWLDAALRAPYKPGVMLPTSQDYRRPSEQRRAAQAGTSAPPDLSAARAAIAGAERPVVVVGLGAARAEVIGALRTFSQALRAPVLCTYMARGCVSDHDPRYAGIFTGGAIEQPCVHEADLIVLVGLDPVELIRKPWPYLAPVLDLVETVHEPHYVVPQERVVGNLVDTLAGLARAVAPSTWTDETIAAHRERFFEGMTVPPAGPGAAGLGSTEVVTRAAAVLGSMEGPRPRLSVDAGAHMFSACAFWPCFDARDLLISNGLATMGYALPAGLAAALHDPERGAVAMTGDGGLLMCLGELKTAAQTGAHLTTIVFNDGRLSLIDIKREERQMPDLGMTWERPDFCAIARGFGLSAWQSRDGASLERALHQAARTPGPKLIDVWIDAAGYPSQLKALRG